MFHPQNMQIGYTPCVGATKKTQSQYWAEATPIRLRTIPDSAPNRHGTAPTRHLKYDTAVAYNLQNAEFFIQKHMNSKQCSRRHHKEREAAMQQQKKGIRVRNLPDTVRNIPDSAPIRQGLAPIRRQQCNMGGHV